MVGTSRNPTEPRPIFVTRMSNSGRAPPFRAVAPKERGGEVSQDWSRRLSAAYAKSGREPHRPVRLPATETMQVTGEDNRAVINLRPGAITGNMQENASAFEAWSLALHHWCGAHVTLHWQPPIPDG